MNIKILIFITMIFCHIVDDYYLQGWLASAKQKDYWKNNYPNPLYKYDYLAALFMHSFSWSFMIMLTPTIYQLIMGYDMYIFTEWIPLFIMNLITHMFVDNLKANVKMINLITDQGIHLCQIFLTWVVMMP